MYAGEADEVQDYIIMMYFKILRNSTASSLRNTRTSQQRTHVAVNRTSIYSLQYCCAFQSFNLIGWVRVY